MRTQIYIENNLLDISEDVDLSFTYAIDDIKNFGSRNTSFSRTLILPANDVNNKAFGHINILGSSNFHESSEPNIGYNFNPAVSAKAVVLVDRVQVFKGSIRIVSITQFEYECFLYGELGGFIFELGNKRLENLDFSEYDQTYSVANITASWNTIAGSGVAYPLIDYGNVSTNKKHFQYSAFRPALYVREYLDKIFDATSYTVQSNFLLESLFDRLVVGHNQKELRKSTSQLLTLSKTTSQNLCEDALIDHVAFDTNIGASFTANVDKTEFTYTPSTTVNTTIDINIFFERNTNVNVTVSIRKNGALIAGTSELITAGVGSTNYTKSVSVTLVQNDVISVRVVSASFITSPYYFTAIYGSGSVVSATPTYINVGLGDSLNVNDCIPLGIFQKDFFLSIVKMFNLYVYENPYDDKKIIIAPYIDFYPNNANTALDWSEKIDRSKDMKQTPMSELNARYYRFKFKDDNDFYNEEYRKLYNENYGDVLVDTEFEFSKDTDSLELIFANSVLYQNVGEDKIFPAIYKLSGATENSMDHVIRLYQLKKLTCASYNILNGSTVLSSPTSYLYAGHVNDPVTPTNDICFGAPKTLEFHPTGSYPFTNIYNTYHSAYLAEITDKDSKLLICWAYLSLLDVQNIDFSKLIFIDGVLFRLNKIIDFDPINPQVTQLELLKVIDL